MTTNINYNFICSFTPIDNQTKPLLSYSDVQSRSVLLKWRVSNGRYDRFNHFIIYYRRLHDIDNDDKAYNDTIYMQDYRQVLIDPRTTRYSFTFRVKFPTILK